MSGDYRYHDPVQPDPQRGRALGQAMLASIYERAEADLGEYSAAFRRIAAAVGEANVTNAARFQIYCNLLADHALALRGELHEEYARRDLVDALTDAVRAVVYRMISLHDGVPGDIVDRDLETLGLR